MVLMIFSAVERLPTEAVTPVKHFEKLSVPAAEQLCAGVLVPVFIRISSRRELQLSGVTTAGSLPFLYHYFFK